MTSVRSDELRHLSNTEAAASALFAGLDSEVWDKILFWSLVAAIIATVAMGIAAAGSAITHRRETVTAERNLDQLRQTMAERVAQAKAEGIEAGRAVSTVSATTAPGPLSSGDLSPEEAPPGEAQHPRNQSLVTEGPRAAGLRSASLSAEATKALIRGLNDHPGNVSVDYDGVDMKTQPLGVQLQDAFKDAGWNVSSGIMLGISAPPKSGILIRANRNGITAPQERVISAFRAAGILFDLRLDREPKPYAPRQAHVPFGMGVDDVEIVVTALQH